MSTETDRELLECPSCGRLWVIPCEQTVCIEKFGECIPCRFIPSSTKLNMYGSGAGTNEELDEVSSAAAEIGKAMK